MGGVFLFILGGVWPVGPEKIWTFDDEFPLENAFRECKIAKIFSPAAGKTRKTRFRVCIVIANTYILVLYTRRPQGGENFGK